MHAFVCPSSRTERVILIVFILTLFLLATPAGMAFPAPPPPAITLGNVSSTVPVVGTGSWGYSANGTAATQTSLADPEALILDGQGNIYFSDQENGVVRVANMQATAITVFGVQIAPGTIATVAGDNNSAGSYGGDGTPASSSGVGLNFPDGVALDTSGNLYIADMGNRCVRMVTNASPYNISTVAGTCTSGGQTGDGAAATSAKLGKLRGLAWAGAVLYIADQSNNVIRAVNTTTSQVIVFGKTLQPGYIDSVAGNYTDAGQGGPNGTYGGDGGPATSAQLYWPGAVAVDAYGNLLIADTFNACIRAVTASQTLTGAIINPVAGSCTSAGYAGDGAAATSALLSNPRRITLDSAGNLYIADTGNRAIRVVNRQATQITIAGMVIAPENIATLGGQLFSSPVAVGLDQASNVYVVDKGNNIIDKLATGSALTFPATAYNSSSSINAQFNVNADTYISNVSLPSNEFWVNAVTGTGCGTGITVPAGSVCNVQLQFRPYYIGLRQAPLQVQTTNTQNNPYNFSFGVSGTGVGPQLAMMPGYIRTWVGTWTQGYTGDYYSSAQLNGPRGVALDSQWNVYIADTGNNAVRMANNNTGLITTIAGDGTGTAGYSGDGQLATSAKLNVPRGVAVDAAWNVYIADEGNNAIRKVDANGIITTFAGDGTGNAGYSGDNGQATSAKLNGPRDLALDVVGNLYFTDAKNNVVRKVDLNGVITTVAGSTSGTAGYSGDGGLATSAKLHTPNGLALDSNNNLFITDNANNVVRVVCRAAAGLCTGKTVGNIYTVAGKQSLGAGYSGDGGTATSAQLNNPHGLAVDAAANLFIADTGDGSSNAVIRKVESGTGYISTVVGTGKACADITTYCGDEGTTATAQLVAPSGLAVDGAGNLFIADYYTNTVRYADFVDWQSYGSMSFPNTAAGLTSPGQILTVANIGNADVTASASWNLHLYYGSDFTIDSSSSCLQAQALPSATSCTAKVYFTPQNQYYDNDYATLGGNMNMPNWPWLGLYGQGLPQSTQAQTTPTITLQTSSVTPTVGFGETLAVTVTSANSSTPTGSVSFFDGSVPLGSVSLTPCIKLSVCPTGTGTATLIITTLAVGPHSITAAYSGDSNFLAVTSSPAVVTVQAVPVPIVVPAITILDPMLTTAGSPDFKLTVTGVNFVSNSVVQWNGSPRGTTVLSSTQLTATIKAADVASVGTADVTVVNPVANGGTSTASTFAIDGNSSTTSGGITVNAQSTTLNVTAGQSVSLPVTLSGVTTTGTTQVTATCQNLPVGAWCTYNNSNQTVTIQTVAGTPAGSYQVLVIFTVQQTVALLRQHVFLASWMGLMVLPIGLFGVGAMRKKVLRLVLISLVGLGLLWSLASCGGSNSATSASTTSQKSMAVTLVVH